VTEAAESTPRATGFKAFLVVWAGQLVSLVGSGLTRFALGVWVYQSTGSVTLFAMISLFARMPGLLLAPFAGALVDRWDRRRTMLASDAVAGLATVGLAVLLWIGELETWYVYLFVTIGSLAEAFQWPAYVASTTLLVPKRHLGRASGMMQFGQAVSGTLAPAVAGFLLVTVGMAGVVITDFATFAIAALGLLLVRIPSPPKRAQGSETPSIWREALYGWTFIRERPGLLGLLGYFAAANLVLGFVVVLVTPMVLSFADAAVLGMVLALINAGLGTGAAFMSAHGGPKRRIHGVLWMGLVMGVGIAAAGLRADPYLVAGALFVALFAGPILNGSSQAIWQSKVPPEVQGRVFAVRRLIAQFTAPIAYLLAGPLVDGLLDPSMAPGGALAGSVGRVLGVGEGRGIGLLFVVLGALLMLLSAGGYLLPRIRRVEDELADAIPDEPEPAR
jgi:MFS family permease